MWVRSQNKSALVNCDNFCIKSEIAYDGTYYEIKSSVNDKIYTLGVYSYKEDVLEVMNEIQDLINNNSKKVYQMPKDNNGWMFKDNDGVDKDE